jgi:glycosyltransferase involved in cell wall biosynthesis
MKVMMFGSEADRRSGQTHVHCKRYIDLLQLAGCDLTFVEHRGITPPNVPKVTYKRYPLRYKRVEKALGTRIANYLRKRSMRLLWRSVRPDICHVQWFDENLWHIARAGLRPLVATAWGTDLNYTAKLSAGDPLQQKIVAALRLIDHLIVDSEDMAATAEQLAGKNLSTTLLPIGIDTAQFRPGLYQQRKEWRTKLKIDSKATVILSARQLGANYRPTEIIHAFAALSNIHFRQMYLIMRAFGHAHGVFLNELHGLANILNVSDSIRWVEEVEYSQLPGLYAASDLVVNFPIIDAFPVTFLECFACGVPVVSNRQISYQSNGASDYLFFAEDDSVDGLTMAIEAAIERLNELKTLAGEAREHVVRNFDECVTARVLRQTYEAVLSREVTDTRRMAACVIH